MSQYFLKPYSQFSGNVKDELDCSNSVTKSDVNNATVVDTLYQQVLIQQHFLIKLIYNLK